MQNHAAQCGSDQDAEIDADFCNVETEEVWHDEEEDTNWCKVDEHSDNLHDDLLNFLNCTDQGAAGLDAVAQHDGGDKYSEQRVGSHSVDDVIGDQRVEHVNDDIVNFKSLALVDGFLVSFVDLQLVTANNSHELRPDQANKYTRVRDSDHGGDHIVADRPASKFSGFAAALGHGAQALDGHDHCCYDHGKDCVS